MQHFIDATKAAVEARNWYAALALALTMPDICGRLEAPLLRDSKARFVAWFDRFLLGTYQACVGPDRRLHTFLCGADCYALRCAFLHQGEFDIDDQRAKQALEKFHFTTSSSHINQNDDTLQLQVDAFCIEVCNAVEKWLTSVQGDADIQLRIERLGTIS